MKMELEVKATESGTISYTVAAGTQIQNGQVLASIGGVVQAPAAPAPSAAPAAAPAPAPVSAGGTKVNAPVAGVYLRNAVNEGASVKKGDNIVIIESMKMELEIKAPCDGKVHFLATAGTQISNGQAVAEIQ
jgi:oxaloacetate decarboxylase alpha subunit